MFWWGAKWAAPYTEQKKAGIAAGLSNTLKNKGTD